LLIVNSKIFFKHLNEQKLYKLLDTREKTPKIGMEVKEGGQVTGMVGQNDGKININE
jgi:hypothetical protein